ncbi:hypothetical protein [Desulfobacter postgatei]|uniref:hypothetical protein n=1 Tax=Desulfobacter postgatei TaxID=2293 RepID=UPI00259B3597|nr:hypothetical protein [uncultured Desulfobacter sp.]
MNRRKLGAKLVAVIFTLFFSVCKNLTGHYCIFLVVLLLLATSSQAETLSNVQKKELTLFGMKAMGLNVGMAQVKKVLSTPEVYEMVATGLNLNGHLCAELVDVSPLKVQSTYEATCIAYRGGTAKKQYVINALKGVAFAP